MNAPFVHASITPDRVIAACESRLTSLDDPGFCLSCGQDAFGVEPDARKYPCECCGATEVYGAEEVLFLVSV